MSDTPRTDALLLEINEGRVYETVGPITELACALERELAEAHRVFSDGAKQIDELKGALIEQTVRADEAELRHQSCTNKPDESGCYVHEVPDRCDRIVWRGYYYHLPETPTSEFQVSNWIPVGERKPPTDGWYLVHRAGFPTELGAAYWRADKWYEVPAHDDPMGNDGCLRITAWQRAPALPSDSQFVACTKQGGAE